MGFVLHDFNLGKVAWRPFPSDPSPEPLPRGLGSELLADLLRIQAETLAKRVALGCSAPAVAALRAIGGEVATASLT